MRVLRGGDTDDADVFVLKEDRVISLVECQPDYFELWNQVTRITYRHGDNVPEISSIGRGISA